MNILEDRPAVAEDINLEEESSYNRKKMWEIGNQEDIQVKWERLTYTVQTNCAVYNGQTIVPTSVFFPRTTTVARALQIMEEIETCADNYWSAEKEIDETEEGTWVSLPWD